MNDPFSGSGVEHGDVGQQAGQWLEARSALAMIRSLAGQTLGGDLTLSEAAARLLLLVRQLGRLAEGVDVTVAPGFEAAAAQAEFTTEVLRLVARQRMPVGEEELTVLVDLATQLRDAILAASRHQWIPQGMFGGLG